MSEIEEKRKKRLQFFHKVYEKTGGSEYKTCNMWTIGEELGFSRDETHDIQRYLTQETLIEPSGMGGSVKMSHYGIVEMEESLTKPKEATEHFPPSINIINIGTTEKIRRGFPITSSSTKKHLRGGLWETEPATGRKRVKKNLRLFCTPTAFQWQM